MPRLLTASLICALGLSALAWAGYVVFAPAARVLTGEPDPEAFAVRAWSQPEQSSAAALAVDGRRGGSLPYAWRAVGRATLHLETQRALAIAGVVVSWQDAPPPAATLHLGSRSVPLPAADVRGESVLWLGAPHLASGASLDVQGAGVAEIQLLPAAAPVWLLAPRAHADRDLELLATYGAPMVARAPVVGELSAVLSHARTIVVSNAQLPEADAAQLRRFVEAGATLIELGPRSAICGAATSSESLPLQSLLLEGQTGTGARWPEALARLPDCSDPGCQNDKVLITARRQDGGAAGPLVVSRSLGTGQCIRWLGDLSQAIRTLRQGDPARASGAHKANDLFAAPTGEHALDVPSADRLGFALARQLTAADGLDLLVAPLPAAGAGLVVYTSDQDFVPGQGELARSESARGVGLTLTLTAADIGGQPDIVYPEASEPMLERSHVEALAERGHSVGVHPNLVGVSSERYAQVIEAHVQRFRERYGAAPRIVRNHHLIWQGYTTMAETLARAGLQLDLNYVSIPAGFMFGSGLPMRFVDSTGELVPIYQQPTQLDDSAFIPEDPATLEATIQRLSMRLGQLLAIARREHVPLTLLHHSHWWFRSAGRLQTTLLAESSKRNMKVWGAAEWLAFTQARRSTQIRRKGSGYEVDVSTDQLALLVEGSSQLRVDGTPRQLQTWSDATGQYLVLPLERGRHLIEP